MNLKVLDELQQNIGIKKGRRLCVEVLQEKLRYKKIKRLCLV